MQQNALARIQAGRHRIWTAALVHELLTLAFRELPGRGIRVSASGRIEPTHEPFSHVALGDFLSLSAHCVPNRKDREIMLYLARRKATNDGMSHEQAADYYELSRKGLYGAGNRAATAFARELNRRWLLPPEAERLEDAPLSLTVIKSLT